MATYPQSLLFWFQDLWGVINLRWNRNLTYLLCMGLSLMTDLVKWILSSGFKTFGICIPPKSKFIIKISLLRTPNTLLELPKVNNCCSKAVRKWILYADHPQSLPQSTCNNATFDVFFKFCSLDWNQSMVHNKKPLKSDLKPTTFQLLVMYGLLNCLTVVMESTLSVWQYFEYSNLR